MQQHYQAFLEEPTAANYRRVRGAILALPDFQPSMLSLHVAASLCGQRHHAEASAQLEEMSPDWALSPRYHQLAAQLAEALGDEEDAEVEQFAACCCLRGLLATGDGSRMFPYLLTYTSDAQDILGFRGLRPVRQALHEHRGRRYDVVACGDGGNYWFDVTDLMQGLPVLQGLETAKSQL
ncbi:MAG: hypothetical protein RIC55_13515 [Pirellulaceae bacterium]